jgi:hypothetical protein
MEPLIIESTSDTPKVNLDAVSGVLEMEERCFPEDATRFFNPIIEWMQGYALNPKSITQFNFKLEYYNTSSSKQLFKVFLILEDISKTQEVIVNWYYSKSDTDMLLSGERYSQLLNLKFKMVEM